MNKTKKLKNKYIPEKFKDIESFTFTTSNDELMVVFHGFEREYDMSDFCEFLFNKNWDKVYCHPMDFIPKFRKLTKVHQHFTNEC